MITKAKVDPIMVNSNLFGLLLAGGQSRRMGRDKASLSYDGRSQPERVAKLLKTQCQEVFVSLRVGQETPDGVRNLPIVLDSAERSGPMAGILSAFREKPSAAWLVVACDLPLIDSATLDNLVENRDPTHVATAYRSSSDSLPEPLFAIYEAHAVDILLDFESQGIFCPRKILISSKTHLLDPVNPRALENVNTPQDYEAILQNLSAENSIETG